MLMDIKKGDIIICVYNGGILPLTYGKHYKVESIYPKINADKYYVINDIGNIYHYPSSNFRLLSELRDEKLDDLLR